MASDRNGEYVAICAHKSLVRFDFFFDVFDIFQLWRSDHITAAL